MDRYTYVVWYVGGIFPWRWQVLCNGDRIRVRSFWSGNIVSDYTGPALNKSMAEWLGNFYGAKLYRKQEKEQRRSVSYAEAEENEVYYCA